MIPSDSPLNTYLRRSVPYNNHNGLPLDIRVMFLREAVGGGLRLGPPLMSVFDHLGETRFYSSVPDQPQPTLKKSILRRWRSLELDATLISHALRDYSLSSEVLGSSMQSLESLVLRGIYLQHNGTKMPKLAHLFILDGHVTPIPDYSSVQSLVLIRRLRQSSTYVPWEQCRNLKTIHTSSSQLFTEPKGHSFPFLTTISLQDDSWPTLRALSTIFNSSRPLDILKLCMEPILSMRIFKDAPQFRAKTVMLSARRLESCPEEFNWEWDELGTAVWDVFEDEIDGLYEIMQKFSIEWGVQIQPLDAQMEAMLRDAERRMDRSNGPNYS